MSGGSYNYMYFKIEEEYVGRMYDPELEEMMQDLSDLLHDLEWWQSGDYDEERYRKSVQKFKDKWFGKRDERLRELIKTELVKVQETLEKI